MRHAPLVAVFLSVVLLLSACQDPETAARLPELPERSTVTLSFTFGGYSPANLTSAAVPSGASSAKVEVFRLHGASRTLVEAVSLSFADPTAESELLTGEVYDFELSLRDSGGTEVAFDAKRHKAVPNLAVLFKPTTVIDQVELGDLYYDGTYLTVPLVVLTPTGTRASHLDYMLNVSVEGGSVSTLSQMGVHVVPDAPGSPVTVRVDVTGMLMSRSEGTISESFVIIPCGETPAEVSFSGDLVPPTVQFGATMSTGDMAVGSTRYVHLYATDDQALQTMSLYVNMKLVWTRSVSGKTYSSIAAYGLVPREPGLYTLHAVSEDAAGNTAVEVLQLVAR
jgi:hypothetical protein